VSRTRYARRDDSRIAYELRGTRRWRRPWLVLIQGMGFDRQGWEPVLRNLGRHFRLVLVDNRGSGRSDLPPGSFGVADMAGDILSVLDGAGIRRAHVMGVSLGGMIAQELAVDHPERIGDLILVSTTPGWPFAYPMPAVSAALIARTGSLTREVAARRHAENALSARTVLDHPEVADRLVALQGTRPLVLATPAVYGKRASAHARWSYSDLRTQWSIRATASCSRTASRARSS
jgi:3-oxoadipate enol-lactonase